MTVRTEYAIQFGDDRWVRSTGIMGEYAITGDEDRATLFPTLLDAGHALERLRRAYDQLGVVTHVADLEIVVRSVQTVIGPWRGIS